jgi:hypothetical protein
MWNGAVLGQKQFFKLESLKNCGFFKCCTNMTHKSNRIKLEPRDTKKLLRHYNKQAKTFLTTTQVGTGNNNHD